MNRNGPQVQASRKKFRETKNDAKPDFDQKKETTTSIDYGKVHDRFVMKMAQWCEERKITVWHNDQGSDDII